MLGKPCYSQFEIYPISGYFSKLGAHLTMLSDKMRLATYRQALKKTIIPGKSIVADIGTGTGILAMMAAKLGAKKVYAVEAASIANIAETLIGNNSLSQRIEIIRGYSTNISLPEKADIVVSETLGFTGFEEKIIEIFADAKDRLARKGAVLIPNAVSLSLVPVSDNAIRKTHISFWKHSIDDFDFNYLSQLARNNIYSRVHFSERDYLSQPANVWKIVLGDKRHSKRFGSIKFEMEKDGNLEGFGGWFTANLFRDLTLTSNLGQQWVNENHWQQFFIPASQPLTLNKGQKVKIDLSMETVKGVVSFSWEVTQLDGEKTIKSFSGSTKKLIDLLTVSG